MTAKPAEKSLFFSRVKAFLDDYLIDQCGKSDKTASSYRDALTVFRRFLTDVKSLKLNKFQYSDVTRDLILEYSEFLQKKYKPTTVNQRLAALKSYIRYCADQDIKLFSLASMAARIPFVKEPSLLRPVLTTDMMKAMIQAPKKGKNHIRDQMILILMYDAALREEELCNLKLSDFHLESGNSYLVIRGKGDKERLVPVSASTEDHIRKYLGIVHTNNSDQPCEYFIYTVSRGMKGKMSTDNIQRIVKKYAEMVRSDFPDMPERVYPHMIRRTRATHLYQDNIPLEMVGRILGHSSIETTKIYATPSVEMLRDSMESSFDMEEEPLWEDDQDLLARSFGLR